MLKQKFVIDFGSKFGIYLVTALTGIVVARLAGPEVVGTIAYATAYVSIFSFITGLFGTAYIKLVSAGENEADCLTTYSRLYGISLGIFVLAVLGFFSYQKYFLNYKFENTDVELVILLMLGAIITGNFFQFSQTVFVATNEQAKSNLPNLLRAVIYNLLRITVVVLGMGAIALASVNLISALLLLPLVFVLFRKKRFGNFNKQLLRKFKSISVPLLTIVIVQSIMMYSDKLILGHFGTTNEIGYYTAAYSIGGLLILLGNTAGTVFFPLFSSLFANNKTGEVIRKIYQFERFIFIFILPIIISLSLFSYPILITLLGLRYEPSVPIFSLLVFSSFFIILGMPYGNVLSGLGLFWLSSLLNFIKFILFSLSLIIFIHPRLLNMGGMALAITQVIMSFFLFISFYYFSWKKIKIQFLKKQKAHIIFWGIIYGLSYFYLIPLVKPLSIYFQSLVIVPAFLLIIYVIQYMFGLIKKSDLKMLYQLINPKLNLKYVKEEFKNSSNLEPPSGL